MKKRNRSRTFWVVRTCGGYYVSRMKPQRTKYGEWNVAGLVRLCSAEFERYTNIKLLCDYVKGRRTAPIKVRLELYDGRGKKFQLYRYSMPTMRDRVHILNPRGRDLVNVDCDTFGHLTGFWPGIRSVISVRLVRVKKA